MHYDIEIQRRLNTLSWLRCEGKTKVSSCFQRFFHSVGRANFSLLIKLDTFAATHSRDLLPHTRGSWIPSQRPCYRIDITWKNRHYGRFGRILAQFGTPATDSTDSIRVYAHTTETRSSAQTADMLGLRVENRWYLFSRRWYQRHSNLRSSYTSMLGYALSRSYSFWIYAWGTSVVLLVLTLQLCLRY